MKRKFVLVIVALVALALCFCACDGTTPCKHEITAYEATAATCTENGNIAYWQCAKCNRYFSDENGETEIEPDSIVVAALDHDWQWVVDKEPTEAEEGLKHEQCTRCDEKRNENTVVEPLVHTHTIVEIVAVEPTCDVEGNVQYWQCSECQKCFADENGETEIAIESIVVAAKGHTELVIPAVAATCTAKGLTESKICSVCGAILIAQEEVPALGHTWGEWKVVNAATCTAKGSDERSCSVCNEKEQRETEKLPHTPSKWIVDVEPTCLEDGSCHKECTVCGEKLETEEILALGHTAVVDEAVAPTCDVVGKTEGKHCSVCDEVLVAQEEIPALGHTASDWIIDVEPNCTEVGSRHKDCTVCKAKLDVEEIAALGHVEVVDKAVAPTCTETGLTEGKHCSVCETVLVAQEEIAAKGHNFVDGVCTACGEYVVSEGLEFTLNADGTAYTVTGIGTCTDTDVVIPATYNDKPVTAIGAKAFENCTSLTSVTILNGMVSIAKDAFDGCENLDGIILK